MREELGDHIYVSKRYICSVFNEMREAIKPYKNWSNGTAYRHLASLVAEAQTLANRMEHSLELKRGIQEQHLEFKRGRTLLKKLNKQIKEKKDELSSKE